MRSTPNTGDPGRIVAHRGASAVAPENTLAAFALAADLGARWIEFDVTLLGDGTPVVHHDAELGRVTDGRGALADMTAASLARIDAGRWFDARFAGERIPTLDAVLDLIEARGLYANLEMKTHLAPSGALAEAVAGLLAARRWATDRILVSSFDHAELDHLRALRPRVPLAVLYGEPALDAAAVVARLRAAALHLDYRYLSQSLLDEMAARGTDVRVFTVNDPTLMAPFRARGLTGVITDDPARFFADPDWRAFAGR